MFTKMLCLAAFGAALCPAEFRQDVRHFYPEVDAQCLTISGDRVRARTPSGWLEFRNGAFVKGAGAPNCRPSLRATGPNGAVWVGTDQGAYRHENGQTFYRQGLRWLPDDHVRSVAVDSKGGAWIATAKGISHIERVPMTFAQKAKFFEDEIDRRHRRTEYGYVAPVHLAVAGDTSKWEQQDTDNDGLWTGMYGAGECFAYAATKDPFAKQRATKAFEALRFLTEVTQGGEHPAPPGFPARAILPTSGPDPNLHDSLEHDTEKQKNFDRRWKIFAPRWPKSADGKWYWKSDTSSDELDGHYFLYAVYYDLVAETEAEKEPVRKVVRAITDHLIDHGFRLIDHDGKPTRWGVFAPESLNDDPDWWEERGLNSLSMLTYLKIAEHMTGDPKYTAAYDRLIRDGKYAANARVAKIPSEPGTGNQSDDEMAMMNYYSLIKYETNPKLAKIYRDSLDTYWSLERAERNPFFNYVAAAYLKPAGDWREESLETLRRLPLDRIDWAHRNSHRKDLKCNAVLSVDERFFEWWNHNPYAVDTGGSGRLLGDGGVFLLPYYMGLYHGFVKD